MLSSEVKALISAIVDLYSTTPLTQALIDDGVNKLIEAKELLLNEDIKDDTLYKDVLVHPYIYKDYIPNTFPNTNNGVVQSINNYKTTDYVDIEKYNFISIHDNISYNICCFYDENKSFIKGLNTNNYTAGDLAEKPEKAKYIIVGSTSAGILPVVYGYSYSKPEPIIFEHESNIEYTVTNINELKQGNFKTGDVVNTKCYLIQGDLGNGTYDIMSEEEYIYLMKPSSLLSSANTQVDGYGNHLLNNGLVAKLRIDNDDMRPEQWGAKGDGVTNDCQAFTHMFAKITSGILTFRENATYLLGLYGGDVSNPTDNPYRTFACGDLLGGQPFSKPILTGANNLVLNGNNCLITIPDNIFGKVGMGILNFSGYLEDVEIYGFNFDGKGRTINYPNKNSNHILFYSPISIGKTETIKSIHPVYTNNEKKGSIKNLSIHDNYFYDAGAMYRQAGDWGGDHILIINPDEVDGIDINHNRFEAWGRWVFAVDLGGNGECMTNVKFNDNVCIGANACKYSEENYNTIKDENNKTEYILQTPDGFKNNPSAEDRWRWRSLGFIDYEARKCWKNMELQRNLIVGSAGWAINGNSRISEDFLIKDNIWLHQGGGYPYLMEFYSGFAKNWLVENNIIPTGGCKIGLTSENITVRNNKGNATFRMFGLQGDIIFENNRKLPNDGFYYHKILSLEGTRRPDYLPDNIEQKAKLTFKNNESGLVGDKNYNVPYLEFDICDNKFDWLEIYNFYHKDLGVNDYSVWENGTISYYGFHLLEENNKPGLNPFGTYYKEGEVICSSVKDRKLVMAHTTYWNHDILTEDQYNVLKLSNNYQHLIGKEIGGVKYSDFKIVCIKSGIIPQMCKYGFRQQMSDWRDFVATGNKLQDNAYVHYEDNLYRNTGATGAIDVENPPVHTQGIATCGEVQLEFIDKLGMAKLIGIE